MTGLFAVEGWVFSVAAISGALAGPLGMALSDWFPGGDDPDGGNPTDGDATDDGFGDLDDLGGLDDLDAAAGDDLDAGLDEFDDIESEDDTGAELEPRIDELESEIASVSSTVSTVRSENEEIGETVGEIEDNVRKLLEIYEMVTRGVNPFVDDVQSGFDSDSFGLFEGPAHADDEGGGLDDDIVEADAESFFDDDFDDGEGGEGLFSEGVAGFGDDTGGDDTERDAATGEEATTFEDLKAEYESSDVGWGDEPADGEPAGDDTAGAGEIDDEPADEGLAGDDSSDGEATFDDLGEEPLDGEVLDRVVGDGGDGTGFEFVADRSDDDGDEEASSEGDGSETVSSDDDGSEEASSDDDGGGEASTQVDGAGARKPYLGELPDGYASELVVMEWMEYLLGHADTPAALRAIRYYEKLGWIDGEVADHLRRALSGFPRSNGTGRGSNGSSLSELTVEHHTNSLEYISQLDPDAVDAAAIRSWPAGRR